MARMLLVLSASLMILASLVFLPAVLILRLFAFFFRQRFVVGDLAHYFSHSLTELALDELTRDLLIFHRVMQQRCDDQVRILTMRCLGHEARHFQQVIDVWLLG